MASLLPTPEPPDPVEGALGHFEHSNWVKASLKALDVGTVHAVGGSAGTLVVDGLTVDSSADQSAQIVLKGNGVRSIYGNNSSDFARWQLILGDGTAEGGSNSGSLFKLYAFTDGGALAHTVLHADRGSGLVEVKGSPTAAKGIATKEYVDNSMPIGAIIAYGGTAAPTGWHICNGTAHGSSALKAVLGGTAAADFTPDLSSRFIVGTGTGAGLSTYAPKATGGVERVTLAATESGIAQHTHVASTQGELEEHHHRIDPPYTNTGTVSADHTHSGTTGWMDRNAQHTHDAYTKEGITTGDSDTYIDTADAASPATNNWNTVNITATDTNHLHSFTTGGISANHYHGVDIAPFWSEGRSAQHTHGVTVNNAGPAAAAASHQNLPPYYALVYIIKKA